MVRDRKWKDYIERVQKTIRTQLLHKPSMYSPETWVSQWTPFFFTENKIGQTLAREMFWDNVNKRWLLSRCDSDGNLLVRQYDLTREAMDVTLIDTVALPGSGIVTHVGEDVSGYSRKELIVTTTGDATIYVQFSDDNSNWYSWYDVQDVVVTFTCSNEKKAWEIIDHTHYLRILIYNSGTSSITVSARLMCQA